MSKHDISNLRRQITARRLNAAERAMNQCLSWSYRFETKRFEAPNRSGIAAVYELWCAGNRIGGFRYFAKGSRPDSVLDAVWGKCGAGRPWLDEEDES